MHHQRALQVAAAVALQPKFLTLSEYYLGLSLVTRLWLLSLNLSHTHATEYISPPSHDGHLWPVSTVAQWNVWNFLSAGFFGLQVEEVFREHSFEHQNITDIESRAIPNITVLYWVFRRMLKLGYFCSRTLHSYGGGCAESVNNNCNKQCNHLHFFLFYFV